MDSMGTPRTTLQLVRRGQFARLWFAGLVSSLGDWVSLFATLALGNALGGTSGVAVPLLGRFLPAVLFGAVSGVVADRFDNRKVMYVSDFARGVLVLGLVFVDSLTSLFFLTLFIEMFSLVRQPAREAAMAGIVTEEELIRANSVSVLATYGTIPLAGIIWTVFATIVPDGAWTSAFVFDSATFMISATLMILLALPERTTITEREAGGWSLRDAMSDFAEGIRYVATHPRIRIPVFGITGALFGGAALFVLGEPFSQDVLGLGSRGFGIVAATLGLGIAAGVFLANYLERLEMEIEFGFAISLALAGVGVFIVAFTDLLGTAAAGAAVAGLGTGGTYVLGFTAIHSAVDDDLRGRTFGALFTLGRISVVLVLPVAPLVAVAVEGIMPGELGDGIRFTLAAAGVIVSIAGVLSAVATARTLATHGRAA
jgi:dTMP kinase